MKKISNQTTSALSVILIAFIGVFAIGELVFSLISPETILGWLKNAHVAYYSASTAVAPKMTAFIMNQSFENLFNATYIRVMAMYVFVLCIPLIYALINIYFISQNGSSNKPFRSSTNACLRTIILSFIVETAFATVLYTVLKLIMRALPFYFMYTMIAVALYSLTIIVFASTISGLINRMGDLRNEHAKQLRRKKREAAPAAGKEEIELELPQPAQEAPQAPPVRKVSTSFDDVLNSIDD